VAALSAFRPSAEEPSVWLPLEPHLIEINFVGMDAGQDPADAYVLDDDDLPLMVFGALSLVVPGVEVELAGTRVRLPRPGGLMLEKLVSDRTGEKGDRDLLVALGLLSVMAPGDLDEFVALFLRLRPDLRHAVRSNLTILSLLEPRAGMPDPTRRRGEVADLLRRLERAAGAVSSADPRLGVPPAGPRPGRVVPPSPCAGRCRRGLRRLERGDAPAARCRPHRTRRGPGVLASKDDRVHRPGADRAVARGSPGAGAAER
jgi:hypothetical protein